MRILSGIQSSGRLHLGNYYGAIRQWVRYQEEGEALYFIANLHSLTSVRDPQLQRQYTQEAVLALLAFGLDPNRSTLFLQSDVMEHTELYWVLGTLVPLANLERAHSYKDKLARGISPDLGLFAYPVLMAADILLYQSDVVPVGRDQVQHIEFARDWATKFNVTYVPGYDPADPEGRDGHPRGVFKLPEARIEEATAVVPGVDGQKMSKSYGNTIDLFGEEKEIKKRIMSIKTDSTPVEAPKPKQAALFQLLKLLAPPDELPSIERSWDAGGVGYGEYKKKLVDYFFAAFEGPRRRRQQLLSDAGEVDRILKAGAEKARAHASPTIRAVREVTGLTATP